MSQDWVKETEKRLKHIEAMKPQDRLQLISDILTCVQAVNISTLGWNQWLTNPQLMSNFEVEALKEFFEKIRTFAVDFLRYDLEVTKSNQGVILAGRSRMTI